MPHQRGDYPIQFAALPYRDTESGIEILLLTTRENARWTIPKGRPMPGKSGWETAAQEALEEAGIRGKISRQSIGAYDHWKRGKAGFELTHVEVFPLRVEKMECSWKEKGERELRWVTPADAMEMLYQPKLLTMLRAIDAEGIEALDRHLVHESDGHLLEAELPSP